MPYLCFQEACHLIAKSLPNNRCADIVEFHRFAVGTGAADWNSDEVKKLLDATTGEVSRTKAVRRRKLAGFAGAVGDGVLHATN